jgi:hypothetical protein
LDPKVNLWVPAVFKERYEQKLDRGVEIIECEARYSNYRRFVGTARIK